MQKRVFTFDQHKISRTQIDRDALFVIETLQNNGFKAYAVGGCVRDLLLGATPKDWDISTSAHPQQIRKLFKNCRLIGSRFILAHVVFGKKILEVSTFRRGDNQEGQLVVSDNNYGDEEEDALRRDFTINGLFYDPSDESILDYVNGYEDIEKRYLRTIGPAHRRFVQDPVRMIRLLKFYARFELEVDLDALQALADCRDEILKSSQARVLEELMRMLESGHGSYFFHCLSEQRFLHILMPNLAKFISDPKHPERASDLFSFLEVIDTVQIERQTAGKRPLSRSVLLAALLHSYTSHQIKLRFTDQNILPHLGQIQEEILVAINEVFNTFFILPKLWRYSTGSTLSTQYRFCPLDSTRRPSYRVPNDPEFRHALKFLNIRSILDKKLVPIWQKWNDSYEKYKSLNPLPPKEQELSDEQKSRRRRRR